MEAQASKGDSHRTCSVLNQHEGSPGCVFAAQVLAQRLHFNTFGGNPVCSAGGRAVLRAIDEDGVQANSAKVIAGLHLYRILPRKWMLLTLRGGAGHRRGRHPGQLGQGTALNSVNCSSYERCRVSTLGLKAIDQDGSQSKSAKVRAGLLYIGISLRKKGCRVSTFVKKPQRRSAYRPTVAKVQHCAATVPQKPAVTHECS